MKIADKISLFIVLLLAILVVNTVTGLSRLALIGVELKTVTRQDLPMIRLASLIRQNQLGKTVLFERLARVVEELNFDEVSPARKQHLLDHARVIRQGFNDLAQAGAREIIKGREIADGLAREHSGGAADVQVRNVIRQIEEAHIQYDAMMEKIFVQFQQEGMDLSIPVLNRVQSQERTLSKKLERLIALMEQFVQDSLSKAAYHEKKAEWMLWMSVWFTVLSSMAVTVLLGRGITRRLRDLAAAARQIGEGRFFVRLDARQPDEFGEVSGAFNTMSEKLAEAKLELEKKNRDLADNLRLTSQQKKDLEKVNQELDNFAHTVSHDLRSPLMGIMGYGSVLESQYSGGLDDRGQRCIQRIRQGTDRMNRMIDDLLELTRLSRVRNPYEPSDIQAIFNDVLERLEYRIKEAGAEIVLKGPLPTIICDRIKLAEVFLNLVGNAVKFSSKRPDGRPRVEAGYERTPEGHRFYVKDNGVGVAKEDQPKIFEMFQRAGNTQEFEGSGAGLSIVKTVIDAHGGRIWIESEPGAGAVFYFIIPDQILSE
jgi:signal transduction histidine kinase